MAAATRPDEVRIMRYIQPLTEEQRALLDKTMQDDPSFRARIRAHSLLLSAQGKMIKDIAQTYQVHRVTVSAWINTWEQHGAESLPDQPRSGRPCTLTAAEQALARQYLKEEPRALKAAVDRIAQKTAKHISISPRKR
jgi:transposase